MFPDLEYSFAWQKGYGVLTFGAKRLPFVIDYIRRQQEHHAADTIEHYLEQMDFSVAPRFLSGACLETNNAN